MASFTVDTAADIVDPNDGRLSLREAIAEANAGDEADRIDFAASLEGAALVLTGGPLTIRGEVRIDGDPDESGGRPILDADGRSRVVMIDGADARVTIEDLTITGGHSPKEAGGGIFLGKGAKLALIDCTVSENGTVDPATAYAGHDGAGIFADDGSSLALLRTEVGRNDAGNGGRGGGIFLGQGAEAVVMHGKIAANHAENGGGIFIAEGSDAVIADTLIEGNRGEGSSYGRGGGLFVAEDGSARIVRSTLADNGSYDGGGVFADGAAVTLRSSTVAGNSAYGSFKAAEGGGIHAKGGRLLVESSTITGNEAVSTYDAGDPAGSGIWTSADTELADTIVAGNLTWSMGVEGYHDVAGTIARSNGHNLFGTPVEGEVAGDVEGVPSALLFAAIEPQTGGGQLAPNGGPTPTVALRDAVDNPALSGAEPPTAATADQRGVARPAPEGSNPDIGAFELDQKAVSTRAGSHNDVLNGTSAADALGAGPGNDLVLGLDGNDDLRGEAGSDTLRGGEGDDRLVGGEGNDVLDGGGGSDQATYRLDDGRTEGVVVDLEAGAATGGRGERDTLVGIEEVVGSIGNDAIYGTAADDRFLGGSEGDDLIRGRGGDDGVFGGPGNDRLHGERGDDRLSGGAGADRLSGGPGHDRFVLDAGTDSGAGAGARDLIGDFARGEDVIDLAAIDARSGTDADDRFAFIGQSAFSAAGQLRYDILGPDTIVQGEVDGDGMADFELELSGMLAPTARDFIL